MTIRSGFLFSLHLPQTPCFPWIPYATKKLMLDSYKMVQKHSDAFHTFLWHFSKFKTRPDCIFEIHPLWLSGFNRVYSNCYCSCSFKPEIIDIGQSSHQMYSNNILNVQMSTTILKTCTNKGWKLIECTTYIIVQRTVPISLSVIHLQLLNYRSIAQWLLRP